MAFEYTPGKMRILGPKEITPHWGGKRMLDPDEYIYFRSFLDEDVPAEDIPIVSKAGIAVVLQADLKKLYVDSYHLFPDQMVDEWVEYYKTLVGDAKRAADSEIWYFEKYLLEARMKIEKYYVGTVEEAYHKLAIQNSKIMDYQYDVIQANEQEIKKQYRDESLQKQKQQVDLKIKRDELMNTDPAIVLRKDEWIRKNIIGYLAGYFVNHPLSYMADNMRSDLEYEVRQEIIEEVNRRTMTGSYALAYYMSMLDLIYTCKDKADFYEKKKEFYKVKVTGHPIARYSMPQTIMTKTPDDEVEVVTYAHPMKRVGDLK